MYIDKTGDHKFSLSVDKEVTILIDRTELCDLFADYQQVGLFIDVISRVNHAPFLYQFRIVRAVFFHAYFFSAAAWLTRPASTA